MSKMILSSPPMGWNSWDCYGAGVNEEQLLGNAEYMANNLKKFGWQYIVCDIQWYEPKAIGNEYNNFTELCMDEYSRLIPAVNRFPSSSNGNGFKPIADKIHNMGLKFGIHIMRGTPRQAVHSNTKIIGSDKTAREIAQQFSVCPWNTDMYGVDYKKDGAQCYYDSIFKMYAEWGIDFVKVDDIANTEFSPLNPYSAEKEIEMIRNAIDKTGRSIVLSLSPGPAIINKVEHLSKYANMWRMTGDFWDSWEKLKEMFGYCNEWYPYVSDGSFPDCDMLPLGRLCKSASYMGEKDRASNFTKDEQKTMMTLWCIFRSPLFFGGELRELDDFTYSLITNDEVLLVNQNSFSAHPVMKNEKYQIWISETKRGESIIAAFNLSDEDISIGVDFGIIRMGGEYTVRDLWKKQNIKSGVSQINVELKRHSCFLYKLIKE